MTFEMYYERRLLAVAFNRIDRYISLRQKLILKISGKIMISLTKSKVKDTILIPKIGHVHVALAERGIQVENHVNINMLLQKSMT